MKDTKISWCDHTFNPWIGCTKVSPACDNCYAEQIASRFKMALWGNHKRVLTSEKYWEQPLRWNKQSKSKHNAWSRFKEQYPGLSDEQLISNGFIKPVKPKVFCGSMCDWLDNQVPIDWLSDLMDLVARTPYLNWLMLTKRPDQYFKRVSESCTYGRILTSYTPPSNVFLGITICNQKEADRDIPKLLNIPVTKRFLSIEPMLGAIDISAYIKNIDWVIVGGESGRKARPMHPDWVRGVRDQCREACIPFFFKQWGEWLPRSGCYHKFTDGKSLEDVDPTCQKWPCTRLTYVGGNGWRLEDSCSDGDDVYMQRVSTKKAGCLLEGIEYNEVPL